MDEEAGRARVAALDIWAGPVRISRLRGGRTNLNFRVDDARGAWVVRLGDDIAAHHVARFNELAAARAAAAAGVSPEVVLARPGLTVIRFIEGRSLSESDIRKPETLGKLVDLLQKSHILLQQHLRGPTLAFWVFHTIRDYGAQLVEGGHRLAAQVPGWLALAAELEAAAGPFQIVFAHNDLVADNIIDDGRRLWLIDWDYAGWNTPLFDLGGLAANNGLAGEAERMMLARYFGRAADRALYRRFYAMKTAAILREVMWSMVSEMVSDLDVDYAAYTADTMARFQAVLEGWRGL